jgi:DNA-binding response OmpR family regulator
MVDNEGTPLTIDELAAQVWMGEKEASTAVISLSIKGLQRKVDKRGMQLIHQLATHTYILAATASSSP